MMLKVASIVEPPDVMDQLLSLSRRRQLSPAEIFDLADAALPAGREEEALPIVQRAAERHRSVASLWQWLGLLARSLDDHERAIVAFHNAAQLEPRNVRAIHGLARSAQEAGLPASPLFERACLLAPADTEILLGRAGARVAEGQMDLALAELDNLLAGNPGWIPGHEEAAHIRWVCGDRDGFLRSYQHAFGIIPREPNIWLSAQIMLMQGELFEEALAMGERGRAAAGQHRRFDEHEAVAASELGMIQRADDLFHHLIDGSTSNFAVRHVRHLLRTHRPEEALRLAEPWLSQPMAQWMWPYVSLAWRITGDQRYDWLEKESGLVGVYDNVPGLPPLDELARYLRELHTAKSQQLDQSVRGGTQTNGPLFSRTHPLIKVLRSAMVSAVDAHIARLSPVDPLHPTLGVARDRKVRFSGSWSVRLLADGYHANHLHPAGWFSSVLYVALPPQTGDLHAGWLALGAPQAALGLDLEPSRLIEPKPGRLVLFPSTTWHGTRPFTSGERLTLAFDVARPPVPVA
jgi:tetratricopeptide (TPR) repeat protein